MRQVGAKGRLRQVVCLEVEPVRGGMSSVRLEAYVVPEISEIGNDRPDIVKWEYVHLKDYQNRYVDRC